MKRYLVKRRDYPADCPRCGSKNREFWGIESYRDKLTDAADCHDCGFTWSVIWKYVKWEPTGEFAEKRLLQNKRNVK